MTPPTRIPPRRWRVAVVTAVLVLGSLLSLGAGWLQQRSNRARVDDELQRVAQQVRVQVQQRMRRMELGLVSARGAVVAAGWDAIDRAAFERYARSRDVDREYPGARGFGLIRRVPVDGEAAFVAAAAADGWPGFAIRALTPHADERFVIQYIEPIRRNREAVGLDIGSEANRRRAARRALQSGEARLTAPITLVQATGKPSAGFLILLPVYRGELPIDADRTTREARGLGWTYAPLVIHEVLDGIDLDPGGYTLQISDLEDGRTRVFFSTAEAARPASTGLPTAALDQPIFGRTWRVEVQARPAFMARHAVFDPRVLALIGLVMSTLLSLALHAALRGREQSRELAAERERRAAALVSSRDAIVMVDPDGRIFDWNQGAEQLFGHRAEDVRGRRAAELLVPPEGQAEVDRVIAAARSGVSPVPFEAERLHRDGRRVEVSIGVAPLRGADGTFAGVCLSMRDIRSLREAARQIAELNASLERKVRQRTEELDAALADLRNTLDAVPALVAYWDAEGRLVRGNRAWIAALGDSVPVAAPPSWDAVMLGRLDGVEAHLDALRQGRRQSFESRLRPADGSVRDVLVDLLPDLREGRRVGFYSVLQDISQQKLVQSHLAAALREGEAFLHTLHTHAIVSMTDRRGTIVDVNHNFCAISQYGRDELIGQNHRIVNSGTHPSAFWLGMWTTITSGKPWRGEICNRARDGSLYWVDSMIAPVPGADGSVERYYSIRFDITQHKADESRLREAMSRAESASRAKSEFLATMSHEIRSPMNAVLGLTYLLGQSRLDAEQRHFLDRIHVASRGLLQIIDDVLDISKIEAGELTLLDEPISPRAVAQDAVAMASALAEGKPVRVHASVDPDVPGRVMGDGLRLAQVLTNLLSNAVKFTAEGEVSMHLDRRVADDGGTWLRIRVRDTGIGMDADALQRIFQPFVQADAGTTRRFGGTGLGLSIVRRLVGMMGGRIEVDSQPGAGSEFRVELPCVKADPGAPDRGRDPALPDDVLAGHTILVVDDADINRDVARRILERKGARVRLAGDGAQAVEQLSLPGHGIDLVLMDVHMPGMDGPEATRRIRRLPGSEALPIIALTAGATTTERDGALAAGMNAFVTKPFEPPALLRCLADHLGIAVSRAPDEAGRTAERGASALPADWPRVEGIEADEVHERLSGDPRLFRKMLGRFVERWPRLGLDAVLVDPPALEAALQRVHQLRGSAGILAMHEVHRLSTEIEEALRGQRIEQALARVQGLDEALARLGIAARAALGAGTPEPVGPAPDAGWPGEQVDELLRLLRRNSMKAAACFEQLGPALHGRLGEVAYRRLADHVDHLRLTAALELLEDALR